MKLQPRRRRQIALPGDRVVAVDHPQRLQHMATFTRRYDARGEQARALLLLHATLDRPFRQRPLLGTLAHRLQDLHRRVVVVDDVTLGTLPNQFGVDPLEVPVR